MDLPGREAGKNRQVTLMVQQQVKLHGPFGLSVLCPVKQRGAQPDERGIQAEEPVLEPELALAELQSLATTQELIKQLLLELPGPVLVGVGQGRSFGGILDAQMPGLAETAGQAAADLPQGVGLSQLAEHHGHELFPAAEALGAFLGPGCMDGFKELTLGNRCRI
jgi:hypothetical protein